MSGTSCVPECNTGYVLEGVTSCANRVLTEAVCIPDVTTRAELKAAVDACVGDRLCELTMPHWDVSQVTDMSFLFEGKSQFNVDISQWEMSQVTDARGMFHGASSFSQAINGWILTSGANTTGMFTGADTWLSRASRTDGSDTTDGPPSAWSVSGLCLENERVCRAGALHAGLASTTARAMTRTRCGHRVRRIWDTLCAEGRRGQLPRRRFHRRGVLQPRR